MTRREETNFKKKTVNIEKMANYYYDRKKETE